jgi:nucleoside phosphorylase
VFVTKYGRANGNAAAARGVRLRPVILVVAATARELHGLEAETLACGIGPVEAAAVTARALSLHRPDSLLHVGIAGGRGIEPPALVLGSEAVYEDIAGDLAATMPRIEREEPDERLLAAARAALPEALVLPIGTTARVGAGHACRVEAMEGFAVLRAARLAGVPALELRAISNDPAQSDRTQWKWEEAFDALREATTRLLSEL